MSAAREFHFEDTDFDYIRDVIGSHTGIVLSDAKRNMVYSRLSRRLRALNLNTFTDYCNLLREEDETELINFINAITTNLTSFFREKHHFEYLEKALIPKFLQENTNKRIRIWSAGCSTGEEPYTIAMVLKESIPNIKTWDVKILATDLDSNVVATAKAGIYTAERIEGISPALKKRWFTKNDDKVQVSSELKELITFNQLNLMHQWPFKGPFDLVFCRNVVIYFSKDTQRELVTRYADYTRDDGHLFLGHSESLFKVTDRYKLLRNTMYQKVK
ncbi:MAG: protein-glutamate O-methyltransferase CheR [Gammaproteobacteria bacterium]|nr:protein-glutamate O-methyltransferase CheR [Gammaproteobacteria bacterium]MCK5091615.1 protein-glutamate O-methyltransferase CheR [Gammaproteobacteria bacterium]